MEEGVELAAPPNTDPPDPANTDVAEVELPPKMDPAVLVDDVPPNTDPAEADGFGPPPKTEPLEAAEVVPPKTEPPEATVDWGAPPNTEPVVDED